MRLPLLALLFLSSACATILRGNNRDLNIYGPAGLQAYQGSQAVPLTPQGTDETGQSRYVASIERHSEKLTLRSPARTVDATLETHTGVGWVILDFLVFWPVALPVDYSTGAWKDFNDISFAANGPPAVATTAVVGPQRPQQQAPPPPSRSSSQGPPQQQSPPAAMGRPLLDRGKLAVLDFTNFAKDLSKEDVHYFADVVRGATLRAAPHMDVMTRENLLVLLQASGKDAAQCEGECEVDTGRRIGADAVISGEVLKVGSRYKISLKLHETHEGRLLSTGVASGKTIDELDEKLQAAATELLAPR